MKDKLECMRKEAVVAKFKILSQYSLRGSDVNRKILSQDSR
jgi:hypothetical protein